MQEDAKKIRQASEKTTERQGKTMTVTIGDSTGCAAIETGGAQLISLRDRSGAEYIWQGDPRFWTGHSPVLFPIVGALKNGETTVGGKTYAMPKHGFAKDREFRVASADDRSVTFLLESDEQTKRFYPFDFRFSVTFQFSRGTLSVRYRIRNSGDTDMAYAVGGHPAFNCPLDTHERFEDYRLVFECPETVGFIGREKEGGLLNFSRRIPLLHGQTELPLAHALFSNNAMIFDSLKSRRIQMVSRKSGIGVELRFDGFDYFGIWSTSEKSPFVALEPLTSCTAAVDETGKLFEKRAMTILPPEESRDHAYSISLLDRQSV